MFDSIERVVYINLAERKDRRIHVEKELALFPASKVLRFDAIKRDMGGIGCSMSHIAVLEMAKRQGWPNVLIVEDDMKWINKEAGTISFEKLLCQPYDVIVVGGTAVECCPHTNKLNRCQTATAYVVAQHYYDTLLANFNEGLALLEKTSEYTTYALDQYWKHIQPRDNWFIVRPNLVMQRPSYSDIEKRVVNYSRSF